MKECFVRSCRALESFLHAQGFLVHLREELGSFIVCVCLQHSLQNVDSHENTICNFVPQTTVTDSRLVQIDTKFHVYGIC